MKKSLFLGSLLCLPFLSCSLCADEAPTPTKEEAPKVRLAESFAKMTAGELIDTGVQKLSLAEQNALVSWWNKSKASSHHYSITKEVTITSIAEEGKHIILSDGSKLSLNSSSRKKIARWSVGDTLGLGEAGKRGSLTVYHMASGQKVKAKREQAPQQKPTEKN